MTIYILPAHFLTDEMLRDQFDGIPSFIVNLWGYSAPSSVAEEKYNGPEDVLFFKGKADWLFAHWIALCDEIAIRRGAGIGFEYYNTVRADVCEAYAALGGEYKTGLDWRPTSGDYQKDMAHLIEQSK